MSRETVQTAQAIENDSEKRAYHHGDLKEALLSAAVQLVGEKGSDGFSLADACRIAGVSTAAPYRHFDDRADLLRQVGMRGFSMLENGLRENAALHPEGSVERIVAMGQTYVAFAAEQPQLFKLMFGPRPDWPMPEVGEVGGKGCFSALLEGVAAWRGDEGPPDPDEIEAILEVAMPLWSIVHGVASLRMDGAYDRIYAGTDTDALIDQATRDYLAGVNLRQESDGPETP